MKDSVLFVIPKPNPNPVARLFFFPFAGGSATTYIPWIEHFNHDIEVVLIQPPGRASRFSEPSHEDMDSVINELIQHAPQMTDVPYIFFGHSLGSCIAFALTQKLQLLGFPIPQYFIASGSKAPHLEHTEERIYDLPEVEFVDRLEKFNGTPKEILSDAGLMEYFIPLLRSDFKISYHYQAKLTKIACPALIMGGKLDEIANHEQLAAWQALFTEPSHIEYFSGGHFFINEAKLAVIQEINHIISRVLSNQNSAPKVGKLHSCIE